MNFIDLRQIYIFCKLCKWLDLTLGIFGVFTLAKDFLIYGFTFKYSQSIFVYLEMLTSAISMFLSTIISFKMYSKEKSVLDSLSCLSYGIILSALPLIIAAIVEGNLVY